MDEGVGGVTRPLIHLAEVDLGRQRSPEHERGDFMVKYLRSANVGDGIILLDDIKAMNFDPQEQATFALRNGDVLVTEGSGSRETVGQSAVWHEDLAGVVCFQNTLLRIRPRVGLADGRFLAWWARHAHAARLMSAVASGANILHLSAEELRRLPVPHFDLAQQRRIADFLDDQVAHIDNIIAARQDQQRLWRQMLQAEVDNSFGSNAGVPVARLARILPGWAFPSDGFTADASDIRLVRGINVGVGQLRWGDTVYWPRKRKREVLGFELVEGDILLGMDRPWIGKGLRIARVDVADLPCLLLQRVAKLVPGAIVEAGYLYWAYQASSFRREMEVELTGLSVPHLSGSQILQHRVPNLDRDQQQFVVAHLEAVSGVAATGQHQARQAIRLLDELKRSLITAAVTGEFDVSSADAPGCV